MSLDDLTLFDVGPACPETRPMAHRGDPETSRMAARNLVESGRLGRQQQAVLDALRTANGSTHGELGVVMGVHWLTPARRLPELERAGYVRKGEPRICRMKGTKCTVWWIVEDSDR